MTEAAFTDRTAEEHDPAEDHKPAGEHDTAEEQGERASLGLFCLSAAAPGLVGLVFIVQALQLGFGSLASPGAGLWPFFFGTILIVLSVVMILTRGRETWPERFSRSSLVIVGVVVLMSSFIAVLPVIGFEIPLFLLLMLWARFIGKETWRYGALLGLLGTGAFVLIFSVALGLPLPRLIG